MLITVIKLAGNFIFIKKTDIIKEPIIEYNRKGYRISDYL